MTPERVLVACPRCGSKKAMAAISGSWLRQRREALGLTQTAVADAAGIGQSNLSNVEAGRRVCGPEVEARLAKVLGFSPSPEAKALQN